MITKDYLMQTLHDFEDVVLDKKYQHEKEGLVGISENTIHKINVVLNKDKNVLLNPAKKGLFVNSDQYLNAIETDYNLTTNGCQVYHTDLLGLAPNTKYKMHINANLDLEVYGWNKKWFKNGSVGTFPSGEIWLEFETNSLIQLGSVKFDSMFAFRHRDAMSLNNVYAVKLADWSEAYIVSDNTGAVFSLDVSLRSLGSNSDTIVYKDGRFNTKKVVSEDGHLLLEPLYEPLSERANNMLMCVGYIRLNSDLDYDISFLDDNGKTISLIKFEPMTYNYIQTKGDKFVNGDYKYTISAMNMSHGVEPDGHYLKRAIFDVVNMGYNTIQFDTRLEFQYNSDGTEKSVSFQNFFDRADFAIACGLRVIFKFYGWVTKKPDESWASQGFTDKMLAYEKMIIDRYKDNPSVIGYSIANEPGNGGLVSSDVTMMDRYMAFIQEIQAYINQNTKQVMFVERTEGVDFSLPNTVFEFHFYAPHTLTHKVAMHYPDPNGLYRSSVSAFKWVYGGSPSIDYPINKVKTNTPVNEDGFVWSCKGIFSKDAWSVGKPFITNYINISLGTNQFDTDVDIKKIRVRFFDKDMNMTREKYITFSADENLTEYAVQGIKSGKSSMTTLTDNNALSIVNEDTLRFSYKTAMDCSRIRITKDSSGAEAINTWNDAFTDDEMYYESSVLLKIATESDKVETYVDTIEGYVDFAYPTIDDFAEKMLDYICKKSTKDIANKIPVYVGEVGLMTTATRGAFFARTKSNAQNLNGDQWIRDSVRAFAKLDLSFAWFTYWGSAFNIYESAGEDEVPSRQYLAGSTWRKDDWYTLVELNNERTDNITKMEQYITQNTDTDLITKDEVLNYLLGGND